MYLKDYNKLRRFYIQVFYTGYFPSQFHKSCGAMLSFDNTCVYSLDNLLPLAGSFAHQPMPNWPGLLPVSVPYHTYLTPPVWHQTYRRAAALTQSFVF